MDTEKIRVCLQPLPVLCFLHGKCLVLSSVPSTVDTDNTGCLSGLGVLTYRGTYRKHRHLSRPVSFSATVLPSWKNQWYLDSDHWHHPWVVAPPQDGGLCTSWGWGMTFSQMGEIMSISGDFSSWRNWYRHGKCT